MIKAQEQAAGMAPEVPGKDPVTIRNEREPETAQRNTDLFVDLASTERYALNAGDTPATPSRVFVEADPMAVVDRIDPDAFFEAAYEPLLARMIAHVVEIEGPVRDSVLARRIARAHGWQRTGSRIQERVDALTVKTHRAAREDVGTFYWPSTRDSGAPVPFRRAAEESDRAVEEICMPELVALAREVIAGGKRGEEAVVAMARELGMRRMGAASRGRFERAVKLAE